MSRPDTYREVPNCHNCRLAFSAWNPEYEELYCVADGAKPPTSDGAMTYEEREASGYYEKRIEWENDRSVHAGFVCDKHQPGKPQEGTP